MIKAVFGFGDEGDKRALVTPKGVSSLMGAVYAHGKDPISTWYARKIHLTQDRLQAYQEFDDMDADDLVGAALDLYAEDASQPAQDSGRRIWVESMNEDVEKICNEMLTRINADEQSFAIARETAKYGNCFSAVIQEQKDDGTPGQIVQLVAAPVYAMSRIEDEEGRLVGYTVAPIEQMGSNVGMTNPSDLTQGKPTDPPWSFIHWRLLGKERIESYGTSLLWPARRPYRRLRMAEDALTIYRIKRSPDRFVFAIKGLSGMSPEDRKRAMRKIRQELRKKHLINKETGSVYQEMDPVGVDEDIIIDDESVSVTRLVGSAQVNHVLDVEYLRKRFFGSLKIPADYMGFSDAAGGFLAESPLAYQDINFARVCKRVQYSVMQGFALACQINMCWLGIDPRAENAKFIIHMSPVSALDEKNQLELERVRAETLEILQRVGQSLGIDSDEWQAYLLQRSKIPTYLLRKSGKEVSPIIKGKVTVTEAKDCTSECKKKITEGLKSIDKELLESFTKLDNSIPLEHYFYTNKEGKPAISKERKFLTMKELFSPTLGTNICVSSGSYDHMNQDQWPLRKKEVISEGVDKGKEKLAESAIVTTWKSDEKKAELAQIQKTMTESLETLEKAHAVEAERLRKLEEAEENFGVTAEDYEDD